MIKQRGFSIVESMIVMIVVIAGLIMYIQHASAQLKQRSDDVAAEHATVMRTAALTWLKKNYNSISAAANPYAQFDGDLLVPYLPTGFNLHNNYDQSYSIRVRRSNLQLQTILVTDGGMAIPEMGMRRAALKMGANGGYVSKLNPNVINGSQDAWKADFGDWGKPVGVGHLATNLFFYDGIDDQYLNRNKVNGHPELNQMDTDVDMNNHDITQAKNISADTITSNRNIQVGKDANVGGFIKPSSGGGNQFATENTPCSDGNGAVRTDPSGSLLVCKSNTWSKVGGSITGQYKYIGQFTGSYSGLNNTNYPVEIIASGGYQTWNNGSNLNGVVVGVGTVVSTSNANDDRAKNKSITFLVPPQTQFSISSNTYCCGPGIFSVFAFFFNQR